VVAPRIKIYHKDDSMDSTCKIVPQLEPVFEPNCMMFKELKEKKISDKNVSQNKRNTLKY
jgi:hypothetical protein